MSSYDSAGAFAVDVQVADMELLFRCGNLVVRGRIYGAGQAEFCVVGDGQAVFEATRLDHCQHRTEDLLLRNRCHRIDIGDHRRLDEVAIAEFTYARAASDKPSAFSD